MTDRALQAQQQTIRIPVYSEEGNRSQNTGASPYGTDQQFLNMIPKITKNPTTGEQEVFAEKRTGIAVTAVKVDAIVAALTDLVVKDNIAISQLRDVNVGVWFDGTVSKHYIIMYRPAAGTVTKLAEIASGDRRDFIHLTELSIGTTAVPYLGVVWVKYDRTNSAAYYSSGATGVLTSASWAEITDADFPPKKGTPEHLSGPMVQMNGTIYVLTQLGRIYNSDYLSVSSWNSLGVIQAVAYPDRGVGLCRYKHHIVVFGEDSIEFFNDVGNPSPASPLERTEQAFIKIGCVSPRLFLNVDDVLYWVSQSSSATTGLWRLDGYTPVPVSNTKQAGQIAGALLGAAYYHSCLRTWLVNGTKNVLINGAYGYLYSMYGTFTADVSDTITWRASTIEFKYNTLCYCTEFGTWWGYNDSSQTPQTYLLPCGYYGLDSTGGSDKYTQYILKSYPGTPSDNYDYSYVYYLDGTDTYGVFQDQAGASGNSTTTNVTAAVQFNEVEFQNQERKRISRIKVLMNDLKTNDTASLLYLRFTKDGSWAVTGVTNILRFISLPSASFRYYFNNFGMFRRAVFCIATKSNGPWLVRGLEMTVSQGTS